MFVIVIEHIIVKVFWYTIYDEITRKWLDSESERASSLFDRYTWANRVDPDPDQTVPRGAV